MPDVGLCAVLRKPMAFRVGRGCSRTPSPANLVWRMLHIAGSDTGLNESQMSPSLRSIILIGDSHIQVVTNAYAAAADCASAPEYEVHKFGSHDGRYQPIRTIDDGQSLWNVTFVADILECAERHKPLFIAAAWGGNEHYIQGTVNSPRRYDFVLPTATNLPLVDGAEIVPYDLLARRFRKPAGALSSLWELLQACCGLPICILPRRLRAVQLLSQPLAASFCTRKPGTRRHGTSLSLQI